MGAQGPSAALYKYYSKFDFTDMRSGDAGEAVPYQSFLNLKDD